MAEGSALGTRERETRIRQRFVRCYEQHGHPRSEPCDGRGPDAQSRQTRDAQPPHVADYRDLLGKRDRAGRGLDGQRMLDVLIAGCALVATSPIMVAAAVAIRLDTEGPALFRQRRLGRDLEPFTVLKLRTMALGASSAPHREYIADVTRRESPAEHNELLKLTQDPRVTRVGRWLRRFSLDELPQLLNVFTGHMSVVGPRPALQYELEFYELCHFERFAVRPGLTGLWQVSGRSRLGFLEMLRLDAEYARRRSLALDLWILARTPAALRGGAA